MWNGPRGARDRILVTLMVNQYDPTMMNTKSLTEIKASWADVVATAQAGIPTVGLNRGKRVVAIVPVEMLDKYLADEANALREMVRARENEDTVPLLAELDAVLDTRDQGTSDGDA